jgi:ubiquinol-cytochrome c reductase cytochrome c1 subunit
MKKAYHLASLILVLAISHAQASEIHLAKVDFKPSPEALRRGVETVTNVCMGCHNLKYLKYSDLSKLGYTPGEIDAKRQNHELSDPLLSQMPADAAMQAFGKVPPDLSMITKAREGGPRYVYSMVTGFYLNEKGEVDNHIFHGIKMPDILGFSGATDPAQRATLQDQVKDVAMFLEWASDPRASERKTLGYYVIGYLLILTTLFYLMKRRIWGQLDKR